jgi:hypothetical protein
MPYDKAIQLRVEIMPDIRKRSNGLRSRYRNTSIASLDGPTVGTITFVAADHRAERDMGLLRTLAAQAAEETVLNQHSGGEAIWQFFVVGFTQSTRITRYKRLWKKLKPLGRLDGLVPGVEVVIEAGGYERYCGIAGVPPAEFIQVIRRLHEDDFKPLFLSSREDFNTAEEAYAIYDTAFDPERLNRFSLLDTDRLALRNCALGDTVIRAAGEYDYREAWVECFMLADRIDGLKHPYPVVLQPTEE